MINKPKCSLAAVISLFFVPLGAVAEEVEAFTEPYMHVAVPAPEIGVIAEILVREGDQVTSQQVLARLDDRILKASLAVAKAAKDALGIKQSAETEVTLRRTHLQSYQKLQDRGNATQRELDRAETEYQQSLARLQSVREDLEVKRLEYLRVKSQIAQRVISAPIDGYVVSIVKEKGEFVAPTDATILHIAHLRSLKAVFAVPLNVNDEIATGSTVKLEVGTTGERCEGLIEFVSPVADAESGTRRVTIRIPNPEHKIQSGVVCRWDLTSQSGSPRLATESSAGKAATQLPSSRAIPAIR